MTALQFKTVVLALIADKKVAKLRQVRSLSQNWGYLGKTYNRAVGIYLGYAKLEKLVQDLPTES